MAIILSFFPLFVSGLSQFRQKAVIHVAQPLKVVDFRDSSRFTSALVLIAGVSLLFRFVARCRKSFVFYLLFIAGLAGGLALNSAEAQVSAAPKMDQATNSIAGANSDTTPHFNVSTYVVQDNGLLPTNIWVPLLSQYTGTNVSLTEIVQATFELQAQYRDQGHPQASIAIAQEQITNGVVTLNVFQTAIPQVVVSGIHYYSPTNPATASTLPAIAPVLVPPTAAATAPPPPVFAPLSAPIVAAPAATAAEIAAARAALSKEMFKLDTEVPDNRVHVVSTNAGPHFIVKRYMIEGNTILTPQDLAMVLTNIDGAYGTNVSLEGVRTVVEQLQKAYRDGGYITVAVGLPQQKITNATIKVKVTEGILTAIYVQGNRYFSSNNVMRALPSFHTNVLLNRNIMEAELNRANANQDRQIYPVIGPGPEPGTTVLTLHVKDQLPLHAKMDLDNYNSPGTPDLRLNTSAVYDNLWQRENALGVQYGFSPQQMKPGDFWNFYDQPAVANYSAFYRLPLGNPAPVANMVQNNPSFGYSEATRQFNMPPLTGSPDLTFFAGGSTIDSGVSTVATKTYPESFTNGSSVYTQTVDQNTVDHDITKNYDLGTRLAIPLRSSSTFNSLMSAGLDFKTYDVSSGSTNIFDVNGVEIDYLAGITNPYSFTANSPIPFTEKKIDYTPLSLHYDANWRDNFGVTTFGMGLNVNLWYWSQTTISSSQTGTNGVSTNQVKTLNGEKSLQAITGSTESGGYWVALTPGMTRTIVINNWTTLLRANGQWASEPLISNEQFGIGGVSSVRGYHEGEAFGDTGWFGSIEERTPPHIVGTVYDGQPLTIRGSIYMDAAAAFLLDPLPGQQSSTKLWGTGVGLMAGIGSHWQAEFLFSIPLITTVDVPRYNPYFNFQLTAQF